jgi:hypothetical protein
MMRSLFATVCLAFALTLASGCNSQSEGGSGQPKLANPNDPKVKDLAPVQVQGGGGNKANPF